MTDIASVPVIASGHCSRTEMIIGYDIGAGAGMTFLVHPFMLLEINNPPLVAFEKIMAALVSTAHRKLDSLSANL